MELRSPQRWTSRSWIDVGAVYDRAFLYGQHSCCPRSCAVIDGMNELAGERNSPPQPRRGRCATEEKLRSHLNSRRRGGVGQIPLIFWTSTTPALRATPPLLRRGLYYRPQFVHTFYDRADFPYSQLAAGNPDAQIPRLRAIQVTGPIGRDGFRPGITIDLHGEPRQHYFPRSSQMDCKCFSLSLSSPVRIDMLALRPASDVQFLPV